MPGFRDLQAAIAVLGVSAATRRGSLRRQSYQPVVAIRRSRYERTALPGLAITVTLVTDSAVARPYPQRQSCISPHWSEALNYKAATAAVFALGGLIAAPPASLALTGIGCPDLPEYARAVGTIENGEGSCNMTMEEARRVIAREQGRSAAVQPSGRAPTAHKQHHRTKKPPM